MEYFNTTSTLEALLYPDRGDDDSATMLTTPNAMNTGGGEEETQLSWSTVLIVYSVFGIGLTTIIAVVGVVANAIVMAVFYRQGIMTESSTVTLFTLALSDFVIQLCHIINALADVFWILEIEGVIEPLYVNPVVVYHFGLRVKYPLGHAICWLTAYLSFERCVCVMFPFKVKRIFTPRFSVLAIVCIFVGTIITFLPIVTRYSIHTTIVNNISRVETYENTIFSEDIRAISVIVNPVTLRPIGIVVMCVCNVILMIKVKSSKKWRKSATASTTKEKTNDDTAKKAKGASQKEEKLIKLILTISGIFIICISPDMLVVILTQTELAIYDWTISLTWYAINHFAESINSAINIFVYYFMSTKFKTEFRQLFGLDKK